MTKSAYICGPLTELPKTLKEEARALYSKLADICFEETGVRAFVPHEHFDPIAHTNFTPVEVDKAERRQITELTNCLIVVALAPTWGGGIEVEMANRSNLPIIIIKFNKRISRLLLGNPAIRDIVEVSNYDEIVDKLRESLRKLEITKVVETSFK